MKIPPMFNKAGHKEPLLVLGASIENAPFIKYLLELGLKVVCTDKSPADYYGQFDSFGDAFKLYAVDFSNEPMIDKLIVKEKIQHTLALPIGRALVCLGRINDKFGFIGPSQEAVDTLTDKLAFHSFCEMHGLNHCHYMMLNRGAKKHIAAALDEIEHKFSYPFIVKPIYGSGSSGVSIISSRDNLLNYSIPERFADDPLLVEQIIEGTEYSCNVFVDAQGIPHSIGMFKKQLSTPPFRQEACYFSDNFSQAYECVQSSLLTICQELKLANCFINADVIITADNEAFIVDIAPRIGGNSLLTLLNFNDNHPLRIFYECVLGNQAPRINPQKCAVMRFFDFPDSFTYQGITSIADGSKSCEQDDICACFSADECEHIISMANNVHVGDILGPMTCGRDILRGHIFVRDDTTAEAYSMVSRYLAAMQ